ncbi:serine carboxypeptidase-like 11 [Neltuma alba]|uniref:serine carboxypeptidase-like 11 n=1 Tax=Neltuma alba TaxID=207710 RepID=UPI0010A2D62D|nr:serine carboxypeptidase-like 11 [Prosopis alba]
MDVFVFYLAKYWANDDNVRKALHIRQGNIGKWRRCFDGNYKSEIVSSFEYHLNLSAKGFRSLIYNGDHDPIISFMATQARIRNLNYTILDDWRPWLVQGQVAGYTKTYSNQMTFATVKGAGHIAPEYESEECFSMFSRWKSNKPLYQLTAASGSNTVHYLPGFQGPLPFHLQTGYVGVGEEQSEDEQVFYYFVKSQNNPHRDPLLLWLSGGPACSSFSGLIFEIGPIAFKVEEYKGSLPNLTLRPHAWTKVSSIIFADLPVGTGFSYSKSLSSPQPSDWKLIHQAHRFLRKWLIDHPEFLSNEVYIGGDSYSGIPVPVLAQEISNGNEEGIQPWINIQGYVLGNALTTNTETENYMIPFLHGMGIISDELYTSFYDHCVEDKKNVVCSKVIEYLNKLILGLNLYNILDPKCEAPREVSREKIQLFPPTSMDHTLPPLSCRKYVYHLAKYWANDENVQKALHIRKGSIGKWRRCFDGKYKSEIVNSFEFHLNVSAKGFRSLIYNGDHDPVISFMATQAWIRNLNYTILDDWRPWLVQGQVAGYTRTYSNQMTFATVKGAGHIAPEYKSEECFAMFSRWISDKPL